MVLVQKAIETLSAYYPIIILVLCITVILNLIFFWYFVIRPKIGPNPFKKVVVPKVGPVEFEFEKRTKLVKQVFIKDKVPDNLDAIVIGSGMGGLTVAAILAKAGKKVLVLERLGKAGGCCHIFGKKGFIFDVGIHYIGQMRNNTISKCLIDQLSDGHIQWMEMDENYDTVAIGKDDKIRKYPIMAGEENFKKALLKHFPNEEAALDKYLKLIKLVQRSTYGFILMKVLPQWICKFLINTGLINLFLNVFKYSSRSVESVLEEITSNRELQTVLTYNWGDYGCTPKNASFFIHALLVNHYLNGASYPIGGPSQFPFYLIPVIEASGGKVLMRAEVTEILMDDQEKIAKGVRVRTKSNESVDIFAPIIISDAGLRGTVERLLPPKAASRTSLRTCLNNIPGSMTCFSLFIGLRGSTSDLNLPKNQIWSYMNTDVDGAIEDYLKCTAEQAAEKDPPMVFISFPSAKDPVSEKERPDTSVCTVIALAKYDWFKTWDEEECGKRSIDYTNTKNAFAMKIMERVFEFYPHLKDKVEKLEIGTPLTVAHYLTKTEGEIYGLEHSVVRFSPENAMILRPKTDIPGLYLTGQDIMTCGLAGAMFGGFLAASTILNRNLMKDLSAVRIKTKKQN